MRQKGLLIELKGEKHIWSSVEDITEQKQAEESLVKSESTHRAMIDNIADVIAIIDQDGINRYKSPNIEKWFGWQPEDVVGTSTFDNVHPEDLLTTQAFFSGLLKKPDTSDSIECRYRCKDNSYKWIEVTAVNLLSNPDIKGVLLNYHDITDRKQAEQALRDSETKHRAMVENILDVITLIDKDGIIRFTSRNIEKWLGWQLRKSASGPLPGRIFIPMIAITPGKFLPT